LNGRSRLIAFVVGFSFSAIDFINWGIVF